VKITCNICNQEYSPNGGGHCRGGAYGGCCRTFSSDAAGDRHRIGPYDPPSMRRCMTDEEMVADTMKDGSTRWRLTPKGWSISPPMDVAGYLQKVQPRG
jgi:hypothetical protein